MGRSAVHHSCPRTSTSDQGSVPRLVQTRGPEPPPSASPSHPTCLTLTFQQGLQDGHVHVLLAVLAFPEDGQQLPSPDDVLNLQQTWPEWALG